MGLSKQIVSIEISAYIFEAKSWGLTLDQHPLKNQVDGRSGRERWEVRPLEAINKAERSAAIVLDGEERVLEVAFNGPARCLPRPSKPNTAPMPALS
jgi:hypothetical protein